MEQVNSGLVVLTAEDEGSEYDVWTPPIDMFIEYFNTIEEAKERAEGHYGLEVSWIQTGDDTFESGDIYRVKYTIEPERMTIH